MVCDICDENSNSEIRKKGEFSYDFETQGMDFSDKNLPRTFRNLKTHVLNHVKSDSHIKARNEQLENDKKDQDDESYNYKVGMKLA